MPEYPRTQKDKIHAYLLVMQEVRERLEVLNAVVEASIHYGLIVEICYLEFRHITELVAIGCLLAHGDFAAYKAFEKEYSPVDVFKRLDGIWPHFFPQPTTAEMKDGHYFVEVNSKPNAMTRKEVESLWSRSGDKLHRLSISKFFKKRLPVTPKDAVAEMRTITKRVVDLLDTHCITLDAPKRLLLVSLSEPDCRVRAQSMVYGPGDTMPIEVFRLE